MARQFLPLAAIALLLVSLSGDAHAGKGSSFSSSGRSSSFSGGSPRQATSPPASTPKPSFSGGSSKPAATTPKPSFSGGNTKQATTTPAAKPSFSGGNTKPAATTPKPSFSGASGTTKTTTQPISGKTPTKVYEKPAAPKWDTLAGKDALKADSRKSYEKSTQPAASYKTPAGQEIKIDPKDREISHLRGQLSEQRWVNRQQREDTFYRSYSSRPVIIYHDSYHPMWNYWLMSQSLDTMALWCYHHQARAENVARINALYAENAALRGRVALLQSQGVVPDPAYVPPGADVDLMYNRTYVDAVYNPTPRIVKHYEYTEADQMLGWIILWIFVIIPLALGLTWLGVWLVFWKKW